MTFKRWISITGLTEASAKKYSSAIFGSISNWAREAGLVDSSLLEISDPDEFERLADKIKQLSIFQERNDKGNNMYSSALNKYHEYLKDDSEELEKDIENIIQDDTYTNTDKLRLIKSRVGQGEFRKNLLLYWKGCAVTGYKTGSMLIASHIKPWRDSNNNERLDSFNGLLLTPNLDKAFDRGFVTFGTNGKILISDILEKPDVLGIDDNMNIKLESAHFKYLEYHREMVFLNF
ncbi:HNH endonuclease [Rhodohalobacter sp. 614A]|uniref:HNH endonuclease n=1 Tax=Rhodohalobacter sp. 614A TaxID=2908649 RepID=UPI001F351D23|nr:HNH endonuclease [Rhodohalobacter sp. 614A]